jgi:hypothetical protein
MSADGCVIHQSFDAVNIPALHGLKYLAASIISYILHGPVDSFKKIFSLWDIRFRPDGGFRRFRAVRIHLLLVKHLEPQLQPKKKPHR